MTKELQFLELDEKEITKCDWCGRKKMKSNEKFYKVFVDANSKPIMTICEICKYGHHIARKLGQEKTFESHFVFFLKHKMVELNQFLPKDMYDELNSAFNLFAECNYRESFRNIGVIAEWLTNKIFILYFYTEKEPETPSKWAEKIDRLLNAVKENNELDFPDETTVLQLSSLKWLRNNASHPSKYTIDEKDVMIGLMAIIYSIENLGKSGVLDAELE